MGAVVIRRRTALVLSGLAAITAAIVYQPPGELMADTSAQSAARRVPRVEATAEAKGLSGDVQMQFVRAGERIAFPLRVNGDALGFTSQWVEVGSNQSGDVARHSRQRHVAGSAHGRILRAGGDAGRRFQRITEPRLAVLVRSSSSWAARSTGSRSDVMPPGGRATSRENVPMASLKCTRSISICRSRVTSRCATS